MIHSLFIFFKLVFWTRNVNFFFFFILKTFFHIFFFRPKRERKLPAHLKAGDFEYSYKGPNDTATKKALAAAAKAAEKLPAATLAVPALSAKEASAVAASVTDLSTEIEDEFLNEGDSFADAKVDNDANQDDDNDDGIPDIDAGDSDEDSDFEDEDEDPNKLWCICQQPHNNRFMICCDSCSGLYTYIKIKSNIYSDVAFLGVNAWGFFF